MSMLIKRKYIMNKYLLDNFLPLIETIQPKASQSFILESLKLERNSSQSILIAFGIRCETFWNKVISDSSSTNLIEESDEVTVDGKTRQIDHNFISSVDNLNYYLESKVNLNFDSEKVKASNKKVKDVQEALNADVGAYFCPVKAEIPSDILTKYNNKDIDVYGVNWLLSKIDAPFTSEEYFLFIEKVLAPVLVEKGL
jgi:hypothetical protein